MINISNLKIEDLFLFFCLSGLVFLAINNFILRRQISYQGQKINSDKKNKYTAFELVSRLPVGVFRVDRHSKCINVNDRFTQITTISSSQLIGNKWLKMIHSDDRHLFSQSLPKSINNYNFNEQLKFRLINRKNEIISVNCQRLAEYDLDNNLTSYIYIVDNFLTTTEIKHQLKESEEKFGSVFNQAAVGMVYACVKGAKSKLLACNPCFCEMLGYTAQELKQLTVAQITYPEDRQAYKSKISELLSREISYFCLEKRYTRKDGSILWANTTVSILNDSEGKPSYCVVIIQDISQQKRTQIALTQSEQRLRIVTENMSDLVCLHKIDGSCEYVTSSCEAMLGYSITKMMYHSPYDFIHCDDTIRVRKRLNRVIYQGVSTSVTYRVKTKAGEYIWLESLVKPIINSLGKIIHIQSTSRNINDRIKIQTRLQHDAVHDQLTGLPNRNLLMERLSLALREKKYNSQFQFAVLFFDLDNFKVINDSLGHLVGDRLLIQVAKILQQFIDNKDLAARFGGDEFVILLEDINGMKQVVNIIQQILNTLELPFNLINRQVFTSASIGVVIANHHHQSGQDILRDADIAMYQAKKRGKNRYAVFNPHMHQQALQRLNIENDLHQAIENQEFILYYQPIVSLRNQKIAGFEALIRWQHPQLGLISPLNFIEIAEETGLIIPIGEWILDNACQQLSLWQKQFFREDNLTMSINLSVKQLQNSLLTQLEKVKTIYQINPQNISLELTESMLIKNISTTYELLNNIKAQGFGLTIDDFGTGYSSLSYLQRLPVETLKIDRSFVTPVNNSHQHSSQVIAESIIALSKSFNLKVIAEGVTTPTQVQWLKNLNCQYGQGYLFSPPVTAAIATDLLSENLFFQF